NPTIVEGQIYGGVAQGIGGAFYERIVYDATGQPLTTSFMDFLMPTAMEVPEIEIVHTETPSPPHPPGVKGGGDAGASPGPKPVAGGHRAAGAHHLVGRYGRPHEPPRDDLHPRTRPREADRPEALRGRHRLHARPAPGGVRDRGPRPGGRRGRPGGDQGRRNR